MLPLTPTQQQSLKVLMPQKRKEANIPVPSFVGNNRLDNNSVIVHPEDKDLEYVDDPEDSDYDPDSDISDISDNEIQEVEDDQNHETDETEDDESDETDVLEDGEITEEDFNYLKKVQKSATSKMSVREFFVRYVIMNGDKKRRFDIRSLTLYQQKIEDDLFHNVESIIQVISLIGF